MRTLEGASRKSLRRAECSAGRSLPVKVRRLAATLILTLSARSLSARVCSICCLYAAAAGEIEGSDFFGAGGAATGWPVGLAEAASSVGGGVGAASTGAAGTGELSVDLSTGAGFTVEAGAGVGLAIGTAGGGTEGL